MNMRQKEVEVTREEREEREANILSKLSTK